MTPHPARPVPQGADPQLAGMLGPLLDHLTELEQEPEPGPDWTNWQWNAPLAVGLHEEILAELSDIEDAMAAAGHHGPLHDTIPALIAEADDVDLLRERLADEKHVNNMLMKQLSEAHHDLDVAAQTLRRRQEDADEFERRASWVLREAMAYCVRDLVLDDE